MNWKEWFRRAEKIDVNGRRLPENVITTHWEDMYQAFKDRLADENINFADLDNSDINN